MTKTEPMVETPMGWKRATFFVVMGLSVSLLGSRAALAQNPKSCSVDADCDAAEYCDGRTLRCAPDVQNGAPLPADPSHGGGACSPLVGTVVCLAGVCDPGDNRCGLPNRRACANASSCRSGVCNSTDGKCGDPNLAPCTTAATCRSGICDEDGHCGRRSGDSCASDVECRAGICHSGDALCGRLSGEPCTAATAYECRGGLCGADGTCGLPNGSSCGDGNECKVSACVNGVCQASCVRDGDCPSETYCLQTAHACISSRKNGEPCTRPGECRTGICSADGRCGVPDGERCSSTPECRGELCQNDRCASSKPQGEACAADTECASGLCADDGRCGVPTGFPCSTPAECRTGICDFEGACAASCQSDAECPASAHCEVGSCIPDATNGEKSGGQNCSRAAQCSSGVCGADGLCGNPNGGACGESSTCRSDLCDPSSGSCVACLVEAQCPPANYCANTRCHPKRANGDACDLPNECVSGACARGACGRADGEACAQSAECRSNRCVVGTCLSFSTPSGSGDAGPASDATNSTTGREVGGGGACFVGSGPGSTTTLVGLALAALTGALRRRRMQRGDTNP